MSSLGYDLGSNLKIWTRLERLPWDKHYNLLDLFIRDEEKSLNNLDSRLLSMFFVLIVTMIKQAYEDYLRHQNDK